MSEPSSSQHIIRTIRLDDDAIAKLLDGLDENDAGSRQSSSTQSYRYRLKGLVVRMQQPGSTAVLQFAAPTRSLSEGAITILHGGFVHPGTRALVQLITVHGTWSDVAGVVTKCDFVSNNIHQIDIKFDSAIDPSVYCADAVHSRVLIAEDDPSNARLVKFHLERLNASVDHAKNGEEAAEMAMANSYDMVLMDIDMPVLDGLEATKLLREKGYTGMIVAATGLSTPEDEKRCLDAGCDRYLPKPFVREDLEKLVQSLREEPLFSTLADDPVMAEIIDEFLHDLPTKIRAIEHAVVDSNLADLELHARTLKSQGTGFGFEVITEVAAKIESTIKAQQDLDAVRSDVDRLVKLCMQARSCTKAAS